jgi:hypothetical protein
MVFDSGSRAGNPSSDLRRLLSPANVNGMPSVVGWSRGAINGGALGSEMQTETLE